MVGSAVGDAIGELAFRYPDERQLRRQVNSADVLRYTDDTAMAMGVAEAILDGRGELEPENLGRIFARNYAEEPWRGYGPGPPSIFRTVDREGCSYREAAGRLFDGEGSMGNGAAMRVAPVGIFYCGRPDLRRQAERSAEVTHVHPLGRDGAAVLAAAVGRASVMAPDEGLSAPDFAEQLADKAGSDEFTEKMEMVAHLAEENAGPEAAAGELGTGVLIHRSVPYAIYSFLSAPHSFERCLMHATLVSGDRDTIGAMAAAVSGAYLGESAVPDHWRQPLENADRIRELARQLHGLRFGGREDPE
jgi:poly(ADP-ribose) glycohydrolase ARH3